MCIIVAYNLVVFVLVARVILNNNAVGESVGKFGDHSMHI